MQNFPNSDSLPSSISSPVSILHVGTPPRKNLEWVMEITSRLGLHLDILGQMSDSQKILARKLGLDYSEHYDLSFDEVIKLYKHALFVSFPSKYEGFGMPILEANALGVPVVAGDIPVLHEVAGEAALFVDPQDISAIKDGFQRMMTDASLRAELIAKGKDNVRRFSPKQIGRQYQEIYHEIMNQ